MTKLCKDFKIVKNIHLHNMYSLLILSTNDSSVLPEIKPGQFVQIEIPNSKSTFLRRPISVNFVDYTNNQLWLLVRRAGDGTAALIDLPENGILNVLLPLGNGFSMPQDKRNILLVGGGVGVAPLLYFGKILKDNGFEPNFLLGAKTKDDLLLVDEFSKYGKVYLSTDDGSVGEPGVVTQNSIFNSDIDAVYCCGPQPMMKAVASIAKSRNIDCEVSLENMMACGLGACLCCVEKTVKGNVCVCTEGPVFNINQLTW
jgi:dihydroorotate dehydrogenase electron transfer subunit